VIPLFIGLSMFNLLCLTIAALLGYGVKFEGLVFAPYHQLSGVLATIACCAVHCIVFTYFIATAKWIQHAIEVKHLDPTLSAPTRSFKAQAFPAALIAMAVVFFTAIAGVITFSYGIKPIWHHLLALLSVATNLVVCVIEYRAIVKNGLLVDSILARINTTQTV
jgi:hypothetical protein